MIDQGFLQWKLLSTSLIMHYDVIVLPVVKDYQNILYVMEAALFILLVVKAVSILLCVIYVAMIILTLVKSIERHIAYTKYFLRICYKNNDKIPLPVRAQV